MEAVDASYALGFVEALFRAAMKPGSGTKKILKKFGKNSLKHWFKHATAKDLMQVKIYDRVREQLELNFRSILVMYSNGTAMNEIKNKGFVAYNSKRYNLIKSHMMWG